jgi:hypothetical protein
LFCWSNGLTPWLLSGILSLPWSPLASLPPEVELPLPLRLGFIALPVVGDVPGVAELAAGSPIVEPRPLGAPFWFWAKADAPDNANAVANTIVENFMAVPFPLIRNNP